MVKEVLLTQTSTRAALATEAERMRAAAKVLASMLRDGEVEEVKVGEGVIKEQGKGEGEVVYVRKEV